MISGPEMNVSKPQVQFKRKGFLICQSASASYMML